MAHPKDFTRIYKRDPAQRVFVNRSLRMEKINFFGFDMDYTLVQYKSPDLEILAFDLAVQRLIDIGYPEEIRKFKYDPIFPVRGLWFDYSYGNLLKVDGFGNILVGMHGFKFLKTSEIEEMYPNKYLQLSESRVFVLNTLFNLPETHLLAYLIDFFDTHPDYTPLEDKTGLRGGDVLMSYKSIFLDCRSAVDWVHLESDMKEMIMQNMEKYVMHDDRACILLRQLREAGRQTFLLTNSDYRYTDKMMSFVLGDDWRSYFNICVVDAKKPKWFAEGTVFREVDTKTGAVKLGIHTGPLKEGVVYSGGSCDAFHKIVKARGKDVLYIGDHIFGDVLRSKKSRGWRTFLVVPELDHELTVWTDRKPLFEQLNQLDNTLADIYKHLDATSRNKPQIHTVLQQVKSLAHEMDQEYGVLGSLFRAGSRTTFFASQVERYADLYASSCYNLVHYPSFYFFRAVMQLMPHESTVDHASVLKSSKTDLLKRQESVGQQVRGWTKKTANENEFCHEEEEDEQSISDGEAGWFESLAPTFISRSRISWFRVEIFWQKHVVECFTISHL
ncbi:hypothetical protein Y032_0002g536 [Ancylostoma ceylanicum]|uniref:HAD superfamily hydrolase, 5'-nucleotidase n=1 Tax=Ancylostoma ceylanicum TaxID=53326 RepID=A0A016W120_9BILA|nr:hypothetical protein Y032_0002g536 [Ancylostoma ceylanicum]